MDGRIINSAFVVGILFTFTVVDAKPCKKDDLIYAYTNCVNHTRWRVAVPGNSCRGGTTTVPTSPYKCVAQCESGKRMSPKKLNEKCEDCPGGTYSIRDGIRFDDWEELPAGFETSGERGDDLASSGMNCSQYKWKPEGTHIASPSGSPCSAVLRYTVHMARKGEMMMEYKYTESSNSLFTVEVQNDECEVNVDSDTNWLSGTKPGGKGAKHHVKLGKGRNRIFIILIDDSIATRDDDSATPTAMIQRIEFRGVAFTQYCTKCRAGAHSTPGSTKCTPCPKDHFSNRGSAECSPCPKNQFSLMGSAKCSKRPQCNPSDYYFTWGPCNPGTAKMTKQYAWIEPKVCTGGVSLPESKEFRSCANNICNPGSYRMNVTSCGSCPTGQISNSEQNMAVGLKNKTGQTEADGCSTCPANTRPVLGVQYTKWWNLPPLMSTVCVSLGIDTMTCPPSGQWLPMGDFIRSGFSSNSWFSILDLKVDGFTGGSDEFSGQLVFSFQLFCKRKCKLYLMMESEKKGHYMVRGWEGDYKDRQIFKYSLRHTGATKFMWIFQRRSSKLTEHHNATNMDYVAIYNVNVTHTKGTPAIQCEPCLMDSKKKCIPCPNGQYFSVKDKKCMACPVNQIVWRTPARSIKDCRPCGVGLRPHNGNSCVIDPYLETNISGGKKRHDLSRLMGNHSLTGVRLFTTRGTEYHHVFYFTINNNVSKEMLPVCASNLTTFGPLKHRWVQSLVCQYTLVPPRKKGGKYLSAQPVSLGDRLVNVTSTNHTPEYFVAINKRLESVGWPKDDDNLDIHLTYVTAEPSQACPTGRTTLLTLRCDPKSNTDEGSVQMPPKCPDGTCDGCNFHFMWKSRISCPICDRENYEMVKSECIGGRQKIYYYPPKYCYFSTKDKHDKVVDTVRCPIISSQAEIAIIIIVVVGIFLVTMLGYCWKRNRRLEYKYMKLVEGQGSRPGELPQAESCAVHEGEEEDDDVHIKSSGGTSSAFFSRFKQFRKTHTFGGDRMETVNLTDRDEFGL